MKNIFSLFLALTSFAGMAQSTLIEFNYHDETYTFYKITKKGKKIQKKHAYSYRGVPVKVVVKDVNTYHYNVSFEVDSYSEIPVGSEQNVETLLSGYSSGLGAFNELVGEVKGNDIYQSLFKDGKFQGISGIKGILGAGGDTHEAEIKELSELTKQLVKNNDSLVDLSSKLDGLFDYMTLVDFTNIELQKLLLNPDLTHEEMVKRANLLADEVFSGKIELNSVISKSTEKSKLLSRYMDSYTAFQDNSDKARISIAGLKPVVPTDSEEELVVMEKTIDERRKAVDINYEKLKGGLPALTQTQIRVKLMEVYDNYDKIISADFNYEYSLLTEQDVTQVTMRFGLVENDSIGAIKTRIINVPTHGGLRINTSAGMSFNSFFNGQNSYLNNNGIIQEVKGDLFAPAISTMFHFYRQSYRPFTVGGNFGISVPIEGDKDFMYMTGLSGIIGKSQRVIINVGAMGGKVDRITDGLKAGDELISEFSDVPMKRVFDFGFFLGVTFNINSMLAPGKSTNPSNNSAQAPVNNATPTNTGGNITVPPATPVNGRINRSAGTPTN